MAKGLFEVYVDPSASVSQPAPTKSRSRKGLSEAGTSWGLGGKENLDPFSGSSGKLGKSGKKVASVGAKQPVACVSSSEASSSSRKSFLAPAAKSIPPPPPPRPSSSSSSTLSETNNGICTGTLRTRVLPTNLAAPAPQTTRSSSTKLDVRALLDASPESLARLQQGSGNNWTELRDSPESAQDSGYARSEGPSETDDDSDDGRDAEDRTVRIPSVERVASEDEFNRRARALTESPMADVTQAFTGLGSFSVPPPISPTRRPTLQRIRSSPSHSGSAPLPTRATHSKKPYAVPGNFPVPSSGPQPLLKKNAGLKSVDTTASVGRGTRALRM